VSYAAQVWTVVGYVAGTMGVAVFLMAFIAGVIHHFTDGKPS